MELLSVPIITLVVQILKVTGLPQRFAPITSLVVGIVFALVFNGMTLPSLELGLILGLSASGLYSAGGKKILNRL